MLTACAISSARTISSWKSRTRASRSRQASIRDLVRLSKETGIPLVATNDCHYLHHDDAHAQEVLLCIQTGKTMSDTNRMKFATDQFYFKTAAEMAQVFRRIAGCAEPHRGYRRALQRKNRARLRILSQNSKFLKATRRELFRKGGARRICLARAVRWKRLAKQGLLRNQLVGIRTAPDVLKST